MRIQSPVSAQKGRDWGMNQERNSMPSDGSNPGPGVASPEASSQQDARQPSMYRVVLHNDDYTTMEFVVDVLVSVFHKPAAEATRIMLDVHRQGHGVCGVYILDVARTKASEVHRRARQREYPLRCTCEPV